MAPSRTQPRGTESRLVVTTEASPPDVVRRLIVTADDFGESSATNHAVVEAHATGILTAASLMVTGSACAEAVGLARQMPKLGVGLHLTLSCGSALLPHASIPGLTDSSGRFPESPALAGWRYFFRSELRESLRREVRAQFLAFNQTALRLDHVSGHQNLHLHPVILALLIEEADKLQITHMRLTSDPFWLNASLDSGRWLQRAIHAVIFRALSSRARSALSRLQIRHTHRVFGLLQNAAVDERYVRRLLERLPPGDSELYSHPSRIRSGAELDALTSPQVKEIVRRRNIRLVRYQDL